MALQHPKARVITATTRELYAASGADGRRPCFRPWWNLVNSVSRLREIEADTRGESGAPDVACARFSARVARVCSLVTWSLPSVPTAAARNWVIRNRSSRVCVCVCGRSVAPWIPGYGGKMMQQYRSNRNHCSAMRPMSKREMYEAYLTNYVPKVRQLANLLRRPAERVPATAPRPTPMPR